MTQISLFAPQENPRVFGVPLGVDFPEQVAAGLMSRLGDAPPETLARVQVLVNTRRMHRRLTEIFTTPGRAGFVPQLRLLTDIAKLPAMADLPPATGSLRRQLELGRLVAGLLKTAPNLAAEQARFDLSASLVRLLDECEGEGVSLEKLAALDVAHLSGHWDRALRFIGIIGPYLDASQAGYGPEARQRAAVLRQIAAWQTDPPTHPVLIAGSTGSRGTTALLMAAVARLPQGALVLPGYDFDQPKAVWDELQDAMNGEDHPQYRFAALLRDLGTHPGDVTPWTKAEPACPERNRLVSLALRPAPVTDQWRAEAPNLTGVAEALAGATLIEAASTREEALAIGLCLREAAEAGLRAAVVTPDRTLTRQITAALDRWRIEPDDSAGRPLSLSAPGRFLRHVADGIGADLTASELIVLLKHPLCHSENPARGTHLRFTRELELDLRKTIAPHPDAAFLRAWASADPAREAWVNWLLSALTPLSGLRSADASSMAAAHLCAAETLAAGPDCEGAGGLWDKTAGQEAATKMAELQGESDAAGEITAAEYRALLQRHLSLGEVRDPVRPDPRIMIWGTLEARVQGADLVILAGLNEGIWPAAPDPDPWMNRQMRHAAGLLLPDRQIGLSAHDFQQAIAARTIVLSRATRDAEAETVPSRWLNRLLNLLGGLGQVGESALSDMRARGKRLRDAVHALDRPTEPAAPAPRPSPKPPREAIPRRISASRVEKLIRDPYTTYAGEILRLKPLDPLDRMPDPALRGTVMHEVMHAAMAEVQAGADFDADLLHRIAAETLTRQVPWPETQTIWQARLAGYGDALVASEQSRLAAARPLALEHRGKIELENGFTLTCEADRIDQSPDGTVAIYDYKTGQLPSKKQIERFSKQLHVEAVIAEAGGFANLPPMQVKRLAYLQLARDLKQTRVDLQEGDIAKSRAELLGILNEFLDGTRGYTARRMMERTTDITEYDHLSRFHEWDMTDHAIPTEVK